MLTASTFLDILKQQASTRMDQPALTFLATDGDVKDSLSYGVLWAQIQSLAYELAKHGRAGERALLLHPPGADYVLAYLACLYAGIVAVPVYPPGSRDRPSVRQRAEAIYRDSRPALALTRSDFFSRIAIPGVVCLATDSIPLGPKTETHQAHLESVAFLQYTSGSTSQPKGVVVTHRSLMANLEAIRRSFAVPDGATVVGWLPLYHDMGLIGNLLETLYVGGHAVLMNPTDFLQNPGRWLEAISRFNAQISGGPNFAYDLCVSRINDAATRQLDLSCWKVAFNGSERVRLETMQRFASKFHGNGFRIDAFTPCYGLAEATLLVSCADHITTRRRASGNIVDISCGSPVHGLTLCIVDPQSLTELPEGETGEIWIAGDVVANSYWNQPNHSSFSGYSPSRPGIRFLRTGDLGYLDGSEVFVSGRLKDIIIIRGQNFFAEDIEATADGSHAEMRTGSSAAFAVETDESEQLVVMIELPRHPSSSANIIAAAVRRAIAIEYQIKAAVVVPIRAGSLIRTSSGKVQRHACREAFLKGTINGVRISEEPFGNSNPTTDLSANNTETGLMNRFRHYLCQTLRIRDEDFDPDEDFCAYGLDSLSATVIANWIHSQTGVTIDAADLFDHCSTTTLMAEIKKHGASEPPSLPQARAEQWQSVEFPLSCEQQRLWTLASLYQDSSRYHIAGKARVSGPILPSKLFAAMAQVMSRHAALRTIIGTAGGSAIQTVLPQSCPPACMVDLSHLEAITRDKAEAECVSVAVDTPFETNEPRWRLLVIAKSSNQHVIVIAADHLVSDAESIRILWNELTFWYNSEKTEEQPRARQQPLQFPQFGEWQNSWMASAQAEKHLAFWTGFLDSARATTLSLDGSALPARGVRTTSRILSKDTFERIRSLAKRNRTTPFVVLLTAFFAALHNMTGDEDICIGVPYHGRDFPGADRGIGFFAYPLMLRCRVRPKDQLPALLRRTIEMVRTCYRHRRVPLGLVAREFATINKSAQPLEILFGYVRAIDRAQQIGQTIFDPLEPLRQTTDLPVSVLIFAQSEAIRLEVQFDAQRVKAGTIEALIEAFAGATETLLLADDHGPAVPTVNTEAGAQMKANWTLSLGATFTLDPIHSFISFWTRELEVSTRVETVPYGQLLIDLVASEGVFTSGESGLNVVLVRVEDFCRADFRSGRINEDVLKTRVSEFIQLAKAALSHGKRRTILFFTPPSPGATALAEKLLLTLTRQIHRELGPLAGIEIVGNEELMQRYPAAKIYDETGDKLAHIPYATEYYAALSMWIARSLYDTVSCPRKVIAVDCDGTLWDGNCGENGTSRVTYDNGRADLQRFLAEQSRAGMLVCLCSRNNREDVEAVFRQHPEMPLRPEHLVSQYVNWKPKAENLVALSAELGLSTDSFIFIDDSAKECAEVKASCPAVCVVLLPADSANAARLLRNHWAFTWRPPTKEAAGRTAMYRVENRRREMSHNSASLTEFLARLQLEVEFNDLTVDDLSRAAELTQRTNQFNTTTIRRTISDLKTILDLQSPRVSCVSVRDRFGDYGMVGLIFYRPAPPDLLVESLLLSCRVLGRGAEQHVMRYLGSLGTSKMLENLAIRFVSSPKNKVVEAFLDNVGQQWKTGSKGDCVYRIPAVHAVNLELRPTSDHSGDNTGVSDKPFPAIRTRDDSERLAKIAAKYADPESLVRGVRAERTRSSATVMGPKRALTETEDKLAEIWRDLLGVSLIEADDDFFASGGSSLLAVQFLSRIREVFGIELPIAVLFSGPLTIARISEDINHVLMAAPSQDALAARVDGIPS